MKHIIRKVKSVMVSELAQAGKSDSSIPPTGNNTLNDNPVANNAPNSPHEVPKNILAFRTITTLLAKIQQENPIFFNETERFPEGANINKEILEISTALANLAVTNDAIVAVATNLSANNLQVVACTNFDADSREFDHSGKPSRDSIFSSWKLILSPNTRMNDPPSNIQHPTIVKTEIPSGIDAEDDVTLLHYIKETCYNKPPTLHEHLWTLRKLLTRKCTPSQEGESKGLTECLLRYIITTCYPKMNRRFTQPHLSAPYLDSLNSVSIAKIEFKTSEPKFLPYDRKFFMQFLPFVWEAVVLTKIPNIRKQITEEAERLAGRGPESGVEMDGAIPFYTKDTYQEFHALLLELLAVFGESLRNLSDAGEDGATSTSNDSGLGSSSSVNKHVSRVKVVASGLQMLTRGAVLETHLETIESSLQEHRRVKTVSTSNEEAKEEQDEDLKAVQPRVTLSGTTLPLYQSYKEWLKLIIIYFDAVDRLSRYVTGSTFRFDDIDIEILVSPPVSDTLLEWKELFAYPGIFPAKNGPANENIDSILNYLRETTDQSFARFTSRAKNLLNALQRPSVTANTVKRALESMAPCKLPGWAEMAKAHLLKIQKSERVITGSDKDGLAADIDSLLKSANYSFLRFLHTVNQTGLHFTGSQHCEATLASLLKYSKGSMTDDTCKDIRTQLEDFGPVVAVSKRCCPTCRHLLSLLPISSQQPYLVKGYHSTVTACTLPPWLPADIVDSMNQFFGEELRKALVKLMNESPLRSRSASTGSQRISIESIMSSDIHVTKEDVDVARRSPLPPP